MTPSQLLQKLTDEGGAIVLSDQCSELEISHAQCAGRFAVDGDGIGYVIRYPEWLKLHKSCGANIGEPSPAATLKAVREALEKLLWIHRTLDFDCTDSVAITKAARENEAAWESAEAALALLPATTEAQQ